MNIKRKWWLLKEHDMGGLLCVIVFSILLTLGILHLIAVRMDENWEKQCPHAQPMQKYNTEKQRMDYWFICEKK